MPLAAGGELLAGPPEPTLARSDRAASSLQPGLSATSSFVSAGRKKEKKVLPSFPSVETKGRGARLTPSCPLPKQWTRWVEQWPGCAWLLACLLRPLSRRAKKTHHSPSSLLAPRWLLWASLVHRDNGCASCPCCFACSLCSCLPRRACLAALQRCVALLPDTKSSRTPHHHFALSFCTQTLLAKIDSFRVDDLKNALRMCGLRVTGNKPQLRERLIAAITVVDIDRVKQAVASVYDRVHE
jgi:hypothetical protein